MASSSASASSNPNPRKRIRIPLSCSFCRAKKKKCDKKRPKCTYCVQHFNADCHYEYEPLSPTAYFSAAPPVAPSAASAAVESRDYSYSHKSSSNSSTNFNTFSNIGPNTSIANSGNGNVHGIVQQHNANTINRFSNCNPLIARENSINSNNSINNINNINHTSSNEVKNNSKKLSLSTSINGSDNTPTNTTISGPPTITYPPSASTFSTSPAGASSSSAEVSSAATAVASLNVAGTSGFGNGESQLAIKVSELQSKISELETLLRLQTAHVNCNSIGNSSKYNYNSLDHNNYTNNDYNSGIMNYAELESYPSAGNRGANSSSSVTAASSPNLPFSRNVYSQLQYQQQQIPQQYKQKNFYQKFSSYVVTDRPLTSQYGPRVDEFEATDFFNRNSSTMVRVNGMTNYKPMHTQYLFNSDTFFTNARVYMNSLYREMKRLLKDVTVRSDYSILTNPLATQLNENFKVAKLLFIVNKSLNCQSPMIDANSKLIASLFASRKSCSTNLPLIKLSYQNTEQARRALVSEIEQILPKSPAEIALLWDVYEKFVYPFLPIIDLSTFKRDIELIIVGLKLDWSSEQPIHCPQYAGNNSTAGSGSTNNSDCDAAGVVRYSVNLTSFIDLGLIANFLIILRLAYLSLKINTEFINTSDNGSLCNVEARIVNLDNLQHIGANFISVAFMCLSQARCLTKNSLSVLNALLYMHFYMVHSEEFSGSSDETERLSLLGQIESMALTVGIYRDTPGVVIFNQGKNHPGVDFYNRTKLTYLTRTLWHFVKKIDTMEFLTSGHPVTAFATKGRKVELPVLPKTAKATCTGTTSASPSPLNDNDEKYQTNEDEEKLNNLINNNVIRQSKVSHWLTAVSRDMYENEKMRIIDVFGFVNEMPEMIFAQFGNPEQYFVNDMNFGNFGQEKRNGKDVTQKTKDNNEKELDNSESISIGATNTNLYYIILDKVMQFEHYVILMTASFKLNGLLLYYYEDKQDLHNYSYVLKEIILLLSSFTRTVIKEYMVNNINFLSIDKDSTMKNFNFKLMPMVGRLAQCALALCGSILFRLFVAVHHFANQLGSGLNNNISDNNFNNTAGLRNFYNVNKQKAKLDAFIALKKNLIKVFEITTKGHFYKVLKFYFQSIKVSAFFGLTLSEFKVRDVDNDMGKDKRIFNFFFDEQTKNEIQSMRYPNSVNEKNNVNNINNGNSKHSNSKVNVEGIDSGANNDAINDNQINFDSNYGDNDNARANNSTEEQLFEFKDAPESLIMMKMTGEQIAELNSILSETGLSVPVGFIGRDNSNGNTSAKVNCNVNRNRDVNENGKGNIEIPSSIPTDRSYNNTSINNTSINNSSINNSSNVKDQSYSYLDELVDHLSTNTLYDTWTDQVLLEDIERNCMDTAYNGP